MQAELRKARCLVIAISIFVDPLIQSICAQPVEAAFCVQVIHDPVLANPAFLIFLKFLPMITADAFGDTTSMQMSAAPSINVG
jgi:hypothetical protein